MPSATTELVPGSPEENSSRSTSWTWRLAASSGSTRSSGSDRLMPKNGAPRSRRTAPVARAIHSPRGKSFSAATTPVISSTHARPIAPAATRTTMSAQQHPRQ